MNAREIEYMCNDNIPTSLPFPYAFIISQLLLHGSLEKQKNYQIISRKS